MPAIAISPYSEEDDDQRPSIAIPRPEDQTAQAIQVQNPDEVAAPKTQAAAIQTDASNEAPPSQAPAITGPGIPTPHKSAIASLWTQADNIHNPVLRVLGKIGAGAARAIDIGSAIAAPGVNAMIPGTELNTDLSNARDLGAAKERSDIARTQAITETEKSKPELAQAKQDVAQQKQDLAEQKQHGADEAALRKLGLKRDASGNPVAVSYEEMSPTEQAAHDLKAAQVEAAEARAELDKSKSNPNNPMYQMQLRRLQVAEQNAKSASSRLGLSQEQFANKLQEQELVKPSGQSQSRGSAAQAALDVMPELETMLKDPEYRKNLGPVMGRLAKGELAIGDVDPKIAKLYTAMQSFYALQPSVHGFRNAEFVKDFETFVGSLSRNPDDTLAGLEGLRGTLQSVAKEGKTYHKRTVEGRDTAQDFGPANGKPEGATGTLNGKKVVVKNGRIVSQ